MERRIKRRRLDPKAESDSEDEQEGILYTPKSLDYSDERFNDDPSLESADEDESSENDSGEEEQSSEESEDDIIQQGTLLKGSNNIQNWRKSILPLLLKPRNLSQAAPLGRLQNYKNLHLPNRNPRNFQNPLSGQTPNPSPKMLLKRCPPKCQYLENTSSTPPQHNPINPETHALIPLTTPCQTNPSVMHIPSLINTNETKSRC